MKQGVIASNIDHVIWNDNRSSGLIMDVWFVQINWNKAYAMMRASSLFVYESNNVPLNLTVNIRRHSWDISHELVKYFHVRHKDVLNSIAISSQTKNCDSLVVIKTLEVVPIKNTFPQMTSSRKYKGLTLVLFQAKESKIHVLINCQDEIFFASTSSEERLHMVLLYHLINV